MRKHSSAGSSAISFFMEVSLGCTVCVEAHQDEQSPPGGRKQKPCVILQGVRLLHAQALNTDELQPSCLASGKKYSWPVL